MSTHLSQNKLSSKLQSLFGNFYAIFWTANKNSNYGILGYLLHHSFFNETLFTKHSYLINVYSSQQKATLFLFAIPIWEFLCHLLDCKVKLKIWNSRVSFEPFIFQQKFLYKVLIKYQFPLNSAKINFIENCNLYLGIFMPDFIPRLKPERASPQNGHGNNSQNAKLLN